MSSSSRLSVLLSLETSLSAFVKLDNDNLRDTQWAASVLSTARA
jgi:hypothetical protein